MLSLFLLFLHLVFDVEKCASQFSGDYVLESRFGVYSSEDEGCRDFKRILFFQRGA